MVICKKKKKKVFTKLGDVRYLQAKTLNERKQVVMGDKVLDEQREFRSEKGCLSKSMQ